MGKSKGKSNGKDVVRRPAAAMAHGKGKVKGKGVVRRPAAAMAHGKGKVKGKGKDKSKSKGPVRRPAAAMGHGKGKVKGQGYGKSSSSSDGMGKGTGKSMDEYIAASISADLENDKGKGKFKVRFQRSSTITRTGGLRPAYHPGGLQADLDRQTPTEDEEDHTPIETPSDFEWELNDRGELNKTPLRPGTVGFSDLMADR
jgi:hypothetical protein